jgi:hypothetical protein
MSIATLDELANSAIGTPEAIYATHSLAVMAIVYGIPGDFVECGVFAGAHPAAMAKAISETGAVGRKVHLFDSFQGIPQAGPMDLDWTRGDPANRQLGALNIREITSSGISACSKKAVEENMARWGVDPDLLVYHEGWFKNTMPTADIGSVALLRLDADLYESTSLCLKYLYNKISRGGWCICDDWTLDGCRKAVEPYLMLRENCPVYWRVL